MLSVLSSSAINLTEELHRTRQDLILARYEASNLAEQLERRRSQVLQHLSSCWSSWKDRFLDESIGNRSKIIEFPWNSTTFGPGAPRPAVEEQGLPRVLGGTAPVSAVDGPTLLALAVAEEGEPWSLSFIKARKSMKIHQNNQKTHQHRCLNSIKILERRSL